MFWWVHLWHVCAQPEKKSFDCESGSVWEQSHGSGFLGRTSRPI